MLTSEGSYPPTTVAGLETNTLWDGLFHAATWVAVAVGVYILWRRTSGWRWAISGRAFIGWLLVGWGLFNLVEGVVDHHILTIHHVRDDVSDPLPWDLGFLAFGLAPHHRRVAARPLGRARYRQALLGRPWRFDWRNTKEVTLRQVTSFWGRSQRRPRKASRV